MTITQNRMVALIDAAGDALRALQQAGDQIQNAALRAERGGNALEELQNLALLVKPQLLLREPVQSLLTYQVERKHFEQKGRWNDKRRAKQAAKRQEAKGQPASAYASHSSAPKSLLQDPREWNATLNDQIAQGHGDSYEAFGLDPFDLDPQNQGAEPQED